MTIQDLGSIGELLAAIATIGTLIYLALQIRQNTRVVRSQSRRQVVESVARDSERFLDYELYNFKQPHGELTEAERARLSAIALTMFCSLEIVFYEIREGTLDPQFQKTLDYRLFTMFVGGTEFLELNRGYLTESFQAYVDDLLAGGLMEEYKDSPLWVTAGDA